MRRRLISESFRGWVVVARASVNRGVVVGEWCNILVLQSESGLFNEKRWEDAFTEGVQEH